jgi:hypothetical protein
MDRLCKVRRLARQSPEPGERKAGEARLSAALEKHGLTEADLDRHEGSARAEERAVRTPPPPPRSWPRPRPRPRPKEPHEDTPPACLQAEIDELWAKIDKLKIKDNYFGVPYSVERSKILNEIVSRVNMREKRRRDREAAEREAAKERAKPAPASVDYSRALNERGYYNRCVYVACSRTGDEVGPIWGHGPNSVTRALVMLTQSCSCGSRFHHDEDDPR